MFEGFFVIRNNIMAETLPDITLSATQYTSINAANGAYTGFPIGTCLEVQHKHGYWVYLVESSTEPPITREGTILTDIFGKESNRVVLSGSLEIWAICAAPAPREARINVQNIE